MLSFTLESVPLPTEPEYVGTWGSAIVATPSSPRVLVSLPTAGHPVRWARVDVETGDVDVARDMRGELRDGVFDSPDEGWLLTTSGLCRVDLSGAAPRVTKAVKPKGLGTYLWRLLPLGPDHLGATGWATRSLAVIDRACGTVEKRIRVVSPHLAVKRGDHVRLYAPHGGECLDLSLPSLARAGRRAMPLGTAPVIHGGELLMASGDRKPLDAESDVDEIWRVVPKAIVALDPESFSELRRAAAPAGARDLLGVDSAGRLIVSTDTGVALLSNPTLHEEGRVDLPSLSKPVAFHAFVEGMDAVVISPDRFLPKELVTIRWAAGSATEGSNDAGRRQSADVPAEQLLRRLVRRLRKR